ncbi:hypothetical protein [Aquamicrobium sp. LC103]|uniref:O-antigen ligase family protein n=1 Tax=Aquamicrobium sp. LC103 TaxID=1120658 RepID=UPI00069A86C8|nr:hypothetical protein [Aquamicrobium sp. LC103]TKT80271.1 O-antigen ligase domain-containing protein [Aquamicrobium sp. LC103]
MIERRGGHGVLVADAGHAPATSVASRPARGGRRARGIGSYKAALPRPVFLFFVSILFPWIIMLGPIRLSGYRMVLLATILPCLVMWLSGKVGRIRVADIAMLFYCLWCGLAIAVVHGPGYAVEPAAIIFLEAFGSYLLARCFIRNADDFRNMVALFFLIIACLLPFALVETLTGRNIALEIVRAIYPTFPDHPMEPRWGLRRVQTVFDHAILFGVVCSSAFALTHLVLGYGQSLARRWFKSGIVFLAAFTSLSSGPLSGLVAQSLLLGWNWVLSGYPGRWRLLLTTAAGMAIFIELFSNRSLPAIFISYFAFNEGSGQYRLLIWTFGSESVMNHPLFGVGFNRWDRPDWMSSSIDMFWLVDAIRHGLPAGLLIGLAFFAVLVPAALKRGLDERLQAYRTGYLIAMTGLFMVGWTVYFWNSTYVIFMFLVGAGVWFLDLPETAEPDRSASSRHRRANTRRRPPRSHRPRRQETADNA